MRNAFVAVLLIIVAGGAMAQTFSPECGAPVPIRGDYLSDRRQLEIVERFHFTPRVETLIGAAGGGRIGADIDYTLRSFPNHHRALVAMRRLAEKKHQNPPAGAGTTVECYFRRAVAFRPDDTVARMLYADFLIDAGRPQDARAQLQATERYADGNPITFHNLGLLYVKLKDYPTALAFAHRATDLGLDRRDLRRSIEAAGQWKDPVPAASSASAASAARAAPAESASAATN